MNLVHISRKCIRLILDCLSWCWGRGGRLIWLEEVVSLLFNLHCVNKESSLLLYVINDMYMLILLVKYRWESKVIVEFLYAGLAWRSSWNQLRIIRNMTSLRKQLLEEHFEIAILNIKILMLSLLGTSTQMQQVRKELHID